MILSGRGQADPQHWSNKEWGREEQSPDTQDSLNAELKQKHDFAVHIASPGMVATELLLGGEREPRAARIINILAEEAEVVAAWMVPRMRGIRGNGRYFKCAPCPHKG